MVEQAEAVVDAAESDLRPVDLGWAKRAVDVVLAAGLLVLAAPVLAIAMLAVAVESRGPVLYRQRRIGWGGRPFHILKLRSMVDGADAMVGSLGHRNEADGLLFKIAHDPRVTKVGRIIRALSIDELPQLVNVLRGEMSLVGPRPLPVDLDSFSAPERRRLAVRPGITGPWQASGRSRLGFADMLRLDLDYVEQWSLATDIRILLQTVPAVLRRRGAC